MQKLILVPAWKRLAAFGFDLLVIEFLLLYPFRNIAENALRSVNLSVMTYQSPVLWLVFAIAAIYILYFTLFEWLLGQTVGKMLLKIISVTFDGKRMSLGQALARNLFLIPTIPFVVLWPLDIIFIIWKRISFSEIISNTKTAEVVEKWTAR